MVVNIMDSRWKIYWAIVLITLINYLVMLLWSLPKLSSMAGGKVPFDMRPGGYSFEEAVGFVSAIDANGRDFYLNTQHLLDTFYPALLAASLAIGFFRLLPRYWGWLMATISIMAGVFDYLENAAVANMLMIAPGDLTPDLVSTASNWTIVKSVSTAVALLTLVILLGLNTVQWIRKRASEKSKL